ncbi:MAG: efflux transporter outer membrane subunit [Lysobacter sp.]
MHRSSSFDIADPRRCTRPNGVRVGLLAALVALSGCVSTPVVDGTPPLPAQWRNAIDAQAAATPDPRSWWSAFADPRLDRLIDEALVANLDVEQARLRLRASRSLYERAGTVLRPELRARTSNPIDPDASASFFVAGLDAIWELGLFGRSEAIHRQARSELDVAQAELREARLSLAAEVARNWIELRDAGERERLLDGIVQARRQQVELQSVRVSLRLAAASSVETSRANAAQAEAALGEPRQRIVAAEQALAVLLGRAEPDPDWRRGDVRAPLALRPIERAPADLLRTRPDVARAQAHVLRAAADLGLAKADRYPHIALGGSIQWSINITAHRRTEAEGIGVFGPIIDIPLFDWGLRRARASAKGDELQAAALAYRKTVLTGVAEVETALSGLDQQRQREDADLRAWQALTKVSEGAVVRRRLGLASALDLAGSEIERDQAAIELNAARNARAMAYIALYKALGAAPDGDVGAQDSVSIARSGTAP